jgi:hypothetical protein
MRRRSSDDFVKSGTRMLEHILLCGRSGLPPRRDGASRLRLLGRAGLPRYLRRLCVLSGYYYGAGGRPHQDVPHTFVVDVRADADQVLDLPQSVPPVSPQREPN